MLGMALFVGTGCNKEKEEDKTPEPPKPKNTMTAAGAEVNIAKAYMLYYGEFDGVHYSTAIFHTSGITLDFATETFSGTGDLLVYDLFSDKNPGLSTGTHAFDYNLDIDEGYDECMYFKNADLSQELDLPSFLAIQDATGSVTVVRRANDDYKLDFNTSNVLVVADMSRTTISSKFDGKLTFFDDSNLTAPSSMEELKNRNPFRKYSQKAQQ